MTYWGTLLKSDEYYSINLTGVKAVINPLAEDETWSVKKAPAFLCEVALQADLVHLLFNFTFLVDDIQRLKNCRRNSDPEILVNSRRSKRSSLCSYRTSVQKVFLKLESVLNKNGVPRSLDNLDGGTFKDSGVWEIIKHSEAQERSADISRRRTLALSKQAGSQ